MFKINPFPYDPKEEYDFSIIPNSNTKSLKPLENKNISNELSSNLEYIEYVYNTSINSDIVVRNFMLNSRNKEYKAFIIYIDGLVNTELINHYILNPLMLKNQNNTFDQPVTIETSLPNNPDSLSIKKVKKFNLEDYIYKTLIPQNSISKSEDFSEIFDGINSGNCALFVDTVSSAFDIDVKGLKQRNVSTPTNENVIKGPQESFVENIRNNTALIRRIVNSEKLVIENISVGRITKTKCAVCYLKDLANSDLVAEAKFRLNNLKIDSLFSSGQLEQLIEENDKMAIPQILSTERPDKCAKHLFQGRVVILVNGNPYALILPAILIDFLSSPEDSNLKVTFANFLKSIRLLAMFLTLLLPGLYISVTNFHQEILPTELLFSILASRQSVPFPIIFELLLMEISFEIIRESGLRIPAPIGPTLGIIGALILGEAAVNADIVSPFLIIVVAITGLSSFAIPDFSFGFHLRVYRFVFIFLGYIAGFSGIALGLFVYLSLLCSMKSFGVDFTSPITPNISNDSEGYFMHYAWKREKRANYLSPKATIAQNKISRKWKF